MDCKQAERLFDAYLDGELSPALKTELGAHRIQCARCRRALALLEVSGHILASDHDTPTLPDDFTERLMGCMQPPQKAWWPRVRMGLYIGGPVAAAAVVALAFLGVFDPRGGQAAGWYEESPPHVRSFLETARSEPAPATGAAPGPISVDERVLEDWLGRAQRNIAAKEQRGESLQRMMDLTVLQLLDVLERARPKDEGEALPDDPSGGRHGTGAVGNGKGVEDM